MGSSLAIASLADFGMSSWGEGFVGHEVGCRLLEAQQRYFSYRAILVAIVSQNYFVLVFLGCRTIIARYVAEWGIAQMCQYETECQGGYRTIWGECKPPLQSIVRYGVSQR